MVQVGIFFYRATKMGKIALFSEFDGQYLRKYNTCHLETAQRASFICHKTNL